MNEQGFSVVSALRPAGRVAPIFQLLGEGKLDGEAVDALAAVLEAEGLTSITHQQLVRASQIALRPRPVAAQELVGARQNPLRRLIAALVYDLAPRGPGWRARRWHGRPQAAVRC